MERLRVHKVVIKINSNLKGQLTPKLKKPHISPPTYCALYPSRFAVSY